MPIVNFKPETLSKFREFQEVLALIKPDVKVTHDSALVELIKTSPLYPALMEYNKKQQATKESIKKVYQLRV